MTESPRSSMAYNAREGRVETIPIDSVGLIRLANQLAVNTAVAQMQSGSTTSLNIQPADNNETSQEQ